MKLSKTARAMLGRCKYSPVGIGTDMDDRRVTPLLERLGLIAVDRSSNLAHKWKITDEGLAHIAANPR